MTTYLMENVREGQRMEAQNNAEATTQQLALVGLREGMTALDAGGATGVVARLMKGIVGERGTVTVLDASADRLQLGRELAGLHGLDIAFVEGDLSSPPLPRNHFDFIWSRFVFEYLADPDAVLAELVARTRPGGKVVVVDLDGHGLFHHPMPPDLEVQAQTLAKALEGRFDFFSGRKLFTRFRRAGLQDIRVHMRPHHFYVGGVDEAGLENWRTKFETIRPVGAKALGSPEHYDAFAKRFLELLKDPDGFTYSVLFIVEGVRPAV